MLLEPQIAGDVGDPEEPERRIHGEPEQRLAGAVQFALQHVVGENDRRAQVVEEVADHVAERIRHGFLVDEGDRLEDGLVERQVEFEDAAVERLVGIVGRLERRHRLGVALRRCRAPREQDRHGDHRHDQGRRPPRSTAQHCHRRFAPD